MSRQWDEFERSLTLVGDEAYLPHEHAPIYPMPKPRSEMTDDEYRAFKREWQRRRRMDPDYRERERAKQRRRDRARGMERVQDASSISDETLTRRIRRLEEHLALLVTERRRRERSRARRSAQGVA